MARGGPTGTYVENFPADQPISFVAPQHVIVDSLPGGASSVVDVSDRTARVLGHVIVDSAPAAGADVTDRTGRLLGHVNVDNASLAVTGTFWQATQPVSGTFWQTTQPVSLASLPALAAGSALIGKVGIDQTTPGTTNGVQVTNASIAVTGTFFQATQPVSLATNTPDVTDRTARLLGHVTVDNASFAVTGTFFQATQPVSLATNTPDVTDRAARLLGHVTVDNASLAVTGTFWQATQPVSGTFWQATQPISAAALPLPSGAATSAKQPALGTAGSASADVLSVQGVASMTALKVDGSAVTQPVSGSVTANAGTNLNTSALALDATLTGNNARARITDGTNLAAVKAASTAPVATDPALVVAWSPNMAPSSVNLLPSAAATINATVVKASAGRLFKIKGYNAKASVVYLKFWNKATTPAPASDAALIIFSFALKASDQFDIDLTPLGFAFSTGIGYTMSTGSANTDVAALTAADVVGLNVMYT